MKPEKDLELMPRKMLRSRFISVRVEEGEDGEPRIVLSGDYLDIAGFHPGDTLDGIVQDGLISLLTFD